MLLQPQVFEQSLFLFPLIMEKSVLFNSAWSCRYSDISVACSLCMRRGATNPAIFEHSLWRNGRRRSWDGKVMSDRSPMGTLSPSPSLSLTGRGEGGGCQGKIWRRGKRGEGKGKRLWKHFEASGISIVRKTAFLIFAQFFASAPQVFIEHRR